MAHHVAEGRPIEERGRQHVEGIEPSTGLPDVLNDEVGGAVAVEPVAVLERVVNLREGHRPGVEPDIEHIVDAAHRGAPGRVVGVRTGQLVDVRPVQVGFAGFVHRKPAEVGFQLGQRAIHVDARVLGVIALPHRNRAAPVPVAGDRPVAGIADPLAELAILHVFGHPVDLVVELAHPVTDVGYAHEPARYRFVDERIAAAPAVRVAVQVAGHAQQARFGPQQLCQGLVRVAPQQPLHRRNLAGELPTVVERDDQRDAGGRTHDLVVFTVGGCLVHDSGALTGRHIVGHEDLPGILRAPLLGVGVEVPEPVVADAGELGAEHGAANRGDRSRRIRIAEIFRVRGDGVSGEQVVGDTLGSPIACAEGSGGHHRIADSGPDGERHVGRKRPRRGGPGESTNGGQPEHLGLDAIEREGHRHRLVLTIAVDVVVHPQFVGRKRCLVVPAVRQHAEALVGEALLVQPRKGPDDTLHERGVESLVVVLEVDPACLPGHVRLPLTGVLEHRLAGLRIERGDAHVFDLLLLGDAQLPHRLELGGQSVGVPPESAMHLLAAHGLKPWKQVFGVPGEEVPVVRQTVGERGAVVEHPFRASVALIDGCLKRMVAFPEREDALLDVGQFRRRRNSPSGAIGVRTQGVGHGAPRAGDARGR